MKSQAYSFVIGVKFSPLFQLDDKTGEIFDRILKDKKCFPEGYFTQIQFSGFEKTLFNPDTKNNIKLTTDNLIYTHRIQPEGDNGDITKSVFEKFQSVLVPTIIDAFDLKIARIGFVFTYSINSEQLGKFVNRYFADGINISEFRFSVPDGSFRGSQYTGDSSYMNKIFSLSRENGDLRISYDYQQYYRPLKPCWRDCKPNELFSDAVMSLVSDLVNTWGE